MSSIHFLGAAGTVTGSRHLVEHDGKRLLLDCGLFQGGHDLEQRNWAPFPVPPASIDAVVLSHAHIDHTGWLPGLIRDGFQGKVWCTPGTRDLAAIMLPDSGRLQEEEAEYANRKKYTRYTPARPLYTEADATKALKFLQTAAYGQIFEPAPGFRVTFHRAGHILGSATVRVELLRAGQMVDTIEFSGDLGRYDTPILTDPEPVPDASIMMIECTYGDRRHDSESPRETLRKLVQETIDHKGVLLIPAFAIGRTQEVLYHLRQLQLTDALGALPIFVDSPMATDATPIYQAHREDHDPEMTKELIEGRRPLQPSFLEFTRSVQESKALNDKKGPMIIISASGMATGGRVMHHLCRRLPDPTTTVVFVGYQAAGTRGRALVEGAKEIRCLGQQLQVRAKVTQIGGFSAHADYADMDHWLSTLHQPPRQLFCVHGEAAGLEATRARLSARGWNVKVPAHLEKVELSE